MCLDKTGTLTSGKPTLLPVGVGAMSVLALAASVELSSEHPIAKAIVDGARERGLDLEQPTAVEAKPGDGIAATVGGQRVLVGTREFLLLAGIEVPEETGAPAAATICYVAVDGAYAGMLAVADPPAPGAREAVAKLRAMGIDVVMISGDREEAARWIAGEVGIEQLHAGVRPTEKAALVAALRAEHRVAMVGDGINDAPALAAADLGIALGSGTEIAAASADVTLLRDGIGNVPTTLQLARATLRTIRRNLAAASIYNVLCIPIAAAGLLSPVLASAAMSLSSVSVLLSSLALRRFRP